MNACVESVCPSPMIPEAVGRPNDAAGIRRSFAYGSPSAWLRTLWIGLTKAREAMGPSIVHVHIDSFYAAVEQAENPRLKGKSVLVVGGELIASASPEAAARGAVAGMPIRYAIKACPNAIVIPGNYARYVEYAARVQQILETFAPFVEMAACGSFYLDFSSSSLPCLAFETKLRRMQSEILGRVGLSVAVGAGSSRMVAALAARHHRPCGLRIVARGEEREFLAPLPMGKMRGISRDHVAMLNESGLTTVGELQRIPKGALVAAFGARIGMRLWNLARGRETDDRARYRPAVETLS